MRIQPSRKEIDGHRRLRDPVSLIAVGVATGAALLVAVSTASRPLAILAIAVPAFLLGTSNPRFLRRVLLIVVAVEIPIQIDVYIGHDRLEAALESVSGFNLSLTSVALAGLIWLLALEISAGTTVVRRIPARLLVPALLYFAAVVASVSVATDTRMSMYEILILGQALVLLGYLAVGVRDRDDVVLVLISIAGAVVFQALLAVALSLGPANLDLGVATASRDGSRIGGTFNSPNSLGGFLVLVLPSMIGLTVGGPSPLSRLAGALASALGIVTLALTFSRGAWLGALFGLSIAFWVAWRRGWVGTRFFIAILLLVSVIGAAMGPEIVERVSALDDAAARSRLPLMELGWTMVTDRPVLGVGANNFATVLPEYLTSEYARAWLSTVHNKYVLVWAETGTLGVAAFLWLLFSALRTAWRSTKTRDATLAAAATGLGAGIAGHMVHMLFDIFNGRPLVHSLWLVLGLIAAVSVASPVPRRPHLVRPPGSSTTPDRQQ